MERPIATADVSARSLSRATGAVIDRVERDGEVVAVSRHGRYVAVIIPVPEGMVLELDASITANTEPVSAPVPSDDVELSDLGRELIIDAASTPTGFWHPPDSAFLEDRQSLLAALFDLEIEGFVSSRGAGALKITPTGRSAARAPRRAGYRGYAEVHGDPYLAP